MLNDTFRYSNVLIKLLVEVDLISKKKCITDRHVEKESLADYINKKREMFLVQVLELV